MIDAPSSDDEQRSTEESQVRPTTSLLPAYRDLMTGEIGSLSDDVRDRMSRQWVLANDCVSCWATRTRSRCETEANTCTCSPEECASGDCATAGGFLFTKGQLEQLGVLLSCDLLEVWRYEIADNLVRPELCCVGGRVDTPAAFDHPATSGLPVPQTLSDAAVRPLRRNRTYVSRFDEQPDVDEALFDFYRMAGGATCDSFVHFPIVDDETIVGAVVAVYPGESVPLAPLLEFAHMVVQQMVAVMKATGVVRKQLHSDFEQQLSNQRTATAIVEAERDLLGRMSTSLANGSGVYSFVRQILVESCRQMNGDYGFITKHNDATGKQDCIVEVDRHPYVADEYVARESELTLENESCPIWLEVSQTLEPCVIRLNEIDEEQYPSFVAKHRRKGHRVLIGAPLLMVYQAMGTLVITSDDETLGTGNDLMIVHALAQHASMAMRLGELSEVNHEVAVRGERSRIARDIHDNLAQFFTGIAIQADAGLELLGQNHDGADTYLERIGQMAREGIRQARQTVGVLSASDDPTSDLATILRQTIRRFCEGTVIRYELDLDPMLPAIDEATVRELKSITTEAVSNIVKHSKATFVRIRARVDGDLVELLVADNGVGIVRDPDADGDDQFPTSGHGLANMRYRAKRMGATLEISNWPEVSDPVGRGTQICLRVPLGTVVTHVEGSAIE